MDYALSEGKSLSRFTKETDRTRVEGQDNYVVGEYTERKCF